MASWNLRRAAAPTRSTRRERRRWLELADALVDGYDAATGIYEQFAGFRALEPLVIAEVAPQRPVAADILLGSERVRAAQVVKQPDALMLHFLVPAETAAESLAANLDFYEPRTAHGSSLSPGVHAALLARAGRAEHALELLRLTARIDLDDISQTTAGGLHVAAMGSVWRALAFGFAGLRPDERRACDRSAVGARMGGARAACAFSRQSRARPHHPRPRGGQRRPADRAAHPRPVIGARPRPCPRPSSCARREARRHDHGARRH